MPSKDAVTKVHTIRPALFDTETFAPFGKILSPVGRTRLPINTYGDKLDIFREDFETDQPTEWFIVRGRRRPLSALFLECHRQLTQTFIPMGGDGFLTIVAPPDAPIGADGVPDLDAVRAFVVPGDAAIQLHRGTWHENPFPLRDGQWFLVTSHAALTRGHQAHPVAGLEALPLDLERRFFAPAGIDLRVVPD